jgi:GTP-binding protein Era
VRILKFDEEGPIIRIFAEILVSKENHRGIVIGKGGQALKTIGTEARKEIEKLLGQKVFLDLQVVSKKDWQKNPGVMRELGYVLPKA